MKVVIKRNRFAYVVFSCTKLLQRLFGVNVKCDEVDFEIVEENFENKTITIRFSEGDKE